MWSLEPKFVEVSSYVIMPAHRSLVKYTWGARAKFVIREREHHTGIRKSEVHVIWKISGNEGVKITWMILKITISTTNWWSVGTWMRWDYEQLQHRLCEAVNVLYNALTSQYIDIVLRWEHTWAGVLVWFLGFPSIKDRLGSLDAFLLDD